MKCLLKRIWSCVLRFLTSVEYQYSHWKPFCDFSSFQWAFVVIIWLIKFLPQSKLNYVPFCISTDTVLPQSRFDLLPQSRLGVIVLGECSIAIARCLLERQASLGENKTSARSGWSSKSKFFWNHHTKRPHGPNGLIVIPSGVPPAHFHKTLVRRKWVPKNSPG